MTFDTAGRYRRKPDIVNAVRLNVEGDLEVSMQVPNWVLDALTDKRLSYGSGWFANTGVALQAAYAGDWLVEHIATGTVEALPDEMFRGRFEVEDTQ